MALQGDLQTVPLRDVLGWLSVRRASGTLSLSRGRIARRFQLRGGRVMLSTSTEEEMLLGRLLMARGLIDGTQLQHALADGGGVRPRLGTALIRAGLVSADDLRGVLTDKIRRLLLDALAWTDGGFYFDDTPPAPRRPTVSAIVGLTDVLTAAGTTGRDDAGWSGPDDTDDVIVGDEDIIEIIELTQPRRPPKAPARKARPRKRRPPALATAEGDDGTDSAESGVQTA